MSVDLKDLIVENHYTHTVPSGKSWYYAVDSAVVVYAIPPNKNISTYLLGKPNMVLELSRLWAPDGHEPNLLTRAIAESIRLLRKDAPQYAALVSYADPNVGHLGGVYRSASWVPVGQSEEGRYYRDQAGQVVSRRKFHSGGVHLKKAEIEALGYRELKLPGKMRYARGLAHWARKSIEQHRMADR